jgi:hypothetical protein
MASDHFASFTRELEFRARLFSKPLDAAALGKLRPTAAEVFSVARQAGASPDFVRDYVSTMAAATVRLNDDPGESGQEADEIRILTDDGVLLLADAQWSESWKVGSVTLQSPVHSKHVCTCACVLKCS